MNLAEHRSFIQRLVEQPYDEGTLRSVYDATGQDPQTYASLLIVAADHTPERVAASHWLTEAARVKLASLRDETGGARLLEAALERDPLNLRAAEHLVELYRAHNEDQELRKMVQARAASLRSSYMTARLDAPQAALAFEQLCGVYEVLGDTGSALQALRTALELERTHSRRTAPSPPPDAPPDSWLRARKTPGEGLAVAPPPEAPWSANPSSERHDTLPSPIPLALVKESPRAEATIPPPSAPPTPPIPQHGAPLLAVIEALHALRRVDDVVEGAALVLKTALQAIPAAAGFVHVCDESTRDFVVVASSGAQNAAIIGTRASDEDPVLVRALAETEAVSIAAPNATLFVGGRFRALPPARAVLCAPAQFDGRQLGAIELVDPKKGASFGDADRHAMTYVGERFAEFLADRSIAF